MNSEHFQMAVWHTIFTVHYFLEFAAALYQHTQHMTSFTVWKDDFVQLQFYRVVNDASPHSLNFERKFNARAVFLTFNYLKHVSLTNTPTLIAYQIISAFDMNLYSNQNCQNKLFAFKSRNCDNCCSSATTEISHKCFPLELRQRLKNWNIV